MARIARSIQPLYQTRGRAVSWPVAMTNPAGLPIDLTGASATADLRWSGSVRALTVEGALDAGGKISISGNPALTADLPLGQLAELVLTMTDSLGRITDYVWPVIGEVP